MRTRQPFNGISKNFCREKFAKHNFPTFVQQEKKLWEWMKIWKTKW